MVMLMILVVMSTGCVITSFASQDEVFIPFIETSNVVIDGFIATEEYTGFYHEAKTGMDIYWEHDGENMYIGLTSPGAGWTGIGFGPQDTGMDGANIIIGYVADDTGELDLSDSIGAGWLHESDSEQGSFDNIVDKAGTQTAEGTIIEFIFPLSSGDINDHNFEMNQIYGFFVAFHEASDDFASYHAARSETIMFRIGTPGELPPVSEGAETVLTLEIPEFIEILTPFTINTRLTDLEGTPLEGKLVRFYIITTYGDLFIGEALTDTEGRVQLEHSHPRPELIEIKAVFEPTTSELKTSQVTEEISVFMPEGSEDLSPEILRIPGTDVEVSLDVLILSMILIFVFGSIYVTYARIIYSLIRIPRMKAPEEVRPQELRFEDIDLEEE